MESVRSITRQDRETWQLVYVVWEITLRCDHACAHCGSRAIKARPDELSREELLDTARQVVDLGAREVTFIGGEAYLRPELPELTAFLVQNGVEVTMQTGGRAVTAAMCRELKDAGMRVLGVSVDGPEQAHDTLRNAPGSHRAAIRALHAAREAKLVTATNMQLNGLSLPHIREHYESLRGTGVRAWRTQLTVPMGRAADRPEWLLQPWQILEAIDTLAELQQAEIDRVEAAGLPKTRAMDICVSNNLGYYGPHEALLRGAPGRRPTFWSGCQAGSHVIGIESDGAVKACPSLPTHPYVNGNMRTDRLEQLWREDPEITFTRHRTTDELWGFCATCYYADVCRAGCAWTAHCTVGKRGNNPFCYHRAETLRAKGVRERLERVEAPPGEPYDYGRFAIVEEPWEGP